VEVDLVETIQLGELVVGRFVDAFGYSVVAEPGVGGVSTIFEVGVKRVDHWWRKENPSTACRVVSIVPIYKVGPTHPSQSIRTAPPSTIPRKRRQGTTVSGDRTLPTEIPEQTEK